MSRTGKLFGFGGLIIAMFMGTLDSTIVNIALPKLMTEFWPKKNHVIGVSLLHIIFCSLYVC